MASSNETPAPAPPFITVPGVFNFRDVGGYPVATESASSSSSTSIVRRGILFRSAELSGLTSDGAAVLKKLGVARSFDLRSVDEAAQQPPPTGPWAESGVERVAAPVFLQQDYGPEALALRYRMYAAEGDEGFLQAYTDILAMASAPTNAAQPFRTILQHLAAASSAPAPILVHCTAGKDRTGVIVALVLALCGVPDPVVAHEYSLTALGLPAAWREDVAARLAAGPALNGDVAAARRMLGSRKGAMLKTLATIREKHGSVEQYVTDLGLLPPEAVARLRENLVVDADEADVRAADTSPAPV
ncbi:protein-tyrosine phosphatase-like protein [Xylariaceae sp. FL0804]|nr:protein-tyrosine phosphatase-like protein [Xylariaceae sp. FL0804]